MASLISLPASGGEPYHGRAFAQYTVFLGFAIIFAAHCAAHAGERTKNKTSPQFVPWPTNIRAPLDNPTTPAKIALGKQLFFDPRLSGDNTLSCATCHDPAKAFGDGLARGKGAGGRELARNTPSLLNVGLFERYLWDGRARSLEEQALGPIESPDEMNQNLDELVEELNAVPGYVVQFQTAFGTRATRDSIAKALAAFQRTLVTKPAPFDRFLAGEKDALSQEAKLGMELFLGEAGCIRCHQGPLLSDGEFYRLGVSMQDRGLGAITGKKEDRGKFRTPSLRNVEHTAPYMHDGSMESLNQVVEFYYRTAPTTPVDGLDFDIRPLVGQSYSEISAIVAFLKSLSGEMPAMVSPELP